MKHFRKTKISNVLHFDVNPLIYLRVGELNLETKYEINL